MHSGHFFPVPATGLTIVKVCTFQPCIQTLGTVLICWMHMSSPEAPIRVFHFSSNLRYHKIYQTYFTFIHYKNLVKKSEYLAHFSVEAICFKICIANGQINTTKNGKIFKRGGQNSSTF